MVRCEYCNAPLLSTTKVCPHCHREQPPYPPVLPGGGGRSYTGWAAILGGIGVLLATVGIVLFFQAPYANDSAYVYGSPESYINGNNPQYLSFLGSPVYPGTGYLIFFGGFAVILFLWAIVSYNRGRRIDRANAALLRSLRNNNNNNRV
jgi:hypothetical protein